jgi:hypothetical protein
MPAAICHYYSLLLQALLPALTAIDHALLPLLSPLLDTAAR